MIIEDDVWIGAGATIAQGVSGDTIIGAGDAYAQAKYILQWTSYIEN